MNESNKPAEAEKPAAFGQTDKPIVFKQLDEFIGINLLYDFYGNLLSDRQKDAMRLYHEENLSLSEIAEEFEISRQGVHDALKNAEKSLVQYENKLGLVARFLETEAVIKTVDESIEKLITEKSDDEGLVERLLYIRKAIDELDK